MNLLSMMTLIANILLLALHLTYTSDGLSTHFEFVPELFPRKPVALSGTTLVINCTMRAVNVDLESKLLLHNLSQLLTFDLQFEFKDNLSTDVQHVDDRTIQLRIYSVRRQLSGGRVSCGVKDRRDSADSVNVVIADVPDISEMPDCVVYNQRYMTCTWPEPDTGIPTNYSLQYNKEYRPGSWSSCPEPAPHSCTWPEQGNGKFINVPFYNIRRSAQNQLGSWRKAFFQFDIADIVKPDAVTNLQVRNLTSRSAVVMWTEPCLVGAKTVTRITYSSDCDSSRNVTSPKNQLSLLNLVPSAVYTLTVSCRQVVVDTQKGLWSDSVTLRFQTLADVPGQNPFVFHETFSSSSQTTELDAVEIFWEPVPICLRHDNTSSVEIFYRPAENTATSNLTVDSVIKDSDGWTSLSASKDSVSAVLPLQTAFDYEVVVLAKTLLGYNHSLPLVPLLVPKRSNRPRLNGSLIVTRNYTQVTVHLPSEHIDRVYWCYTSVNSRKCQMPLIWENVGNGIRDLKLQFDKPDLLMFAVRAQFNKSSPGVTVSDMKWSDCIYDVNKGVMKPTAVKFSRHNAPLSLALEWTEPSCTLSSYITHYYVQYCRLNVSNCTDNKVLVITAPATRAVINNLAPASVYQARVMSGSSQENSSFTDFVVSENVIVVHDVKSSNNNSKMSVNSTVSVVVSIVAATLIAVVIILSVWCVMRWRQQIPIKTPEAVKPDFSATEIVRSSTCLVDSAAVCLYRSTLPEHSVAGDNAPEQFDNDMVDIGTPEQQSLLASQSASSVSSDRAVSAVIS